jgi:acetyl esterase
VGLMPVRGQSAASPKAPLVLHLHGGTFRGLSQPAHAVPTILADTGAVVISADYPTAPAYPFPHALQALNSTLDWIGASGFLADRDLFIAGEEAGANLVAGLAVMVRDQSTLPLAGQILISPMLDPRLGTQSIRLAALGPAGGKFANGWQDYLGSTAGVPHPYAAPLGSSRLAGLPPALIITAEDDPFRDEALQYTARLRSCGVSVQDHTLSGQTGWPDALQRLRKPELPGVSEVQTLIAEFLRLNSSSPRMRKSRAPRARS